MIDESLRIKLNQFILAYERRCADLQFQKQNIKQNVMLSIIQNKNNKRNNVQAISNSMERSMAKSKVNQNLSSSKQTKFSQHKQADNKFAEPQSQQMNVDELQKSKLVASGSSRLLQRSNMSMRQNKSSRLKNNFLVDHNQQPQRLNDQPLQRPKKSGLYNNPYYKPISNMIVDVEENDSVKDRNPSVAFTKNKSQLKNPQQSQLQNIQPYQKLTQSHFHQHQEDIIHESSISRSNNQSRVTQRQLQKQLEESYSPQTQSAIFHKKSMIGSKVYGYSEKVIKQNPSSIIKQEEQEEGGMQNYPTFQKPSFQFITNLSQLRQSNPQQEDQNEQDQPQNYEKQEYYDRQRQDQHEQEQQQVSHKKWNSNRRNTNTNRWQEQDDSENDEEESYVQAREETFAQGNSYVNSMSNLQQDESMMIPSHVNVKEKPPLPQQRKSYLAFQINMQKSNLPTNQNIEELKKKKILQLQRKRQQRMQNNSRRKLNPSEINTPKQKQPQPQQKSYNNIFAVPNRQTAHRDSQNRDSLNKSVNDRKNDKSSRGFRNSGYKEDDSAKESMFQDNRTVITKYGQESKYSNNNNNNRSISPLHTVKTVHTTDKRPPLNRNRREDNIFSGGGQSAFQRQRGQQSSYQRERSSQKLTEPKIVPIDRKNSFQKKSNIKLMINAITYTCLPGQLNRREREKFIDILDDYESEFFVFLFKQYSRKVIKGIYIMQANQDRIVKIYGDRAPLEIFPQQVHQFYRFDSGSREFKKIDGCKSFSFSIHAVDLK